MNFRIFDQADQGWRRLVPVGKFEEAANVINTYININKGTLNADELCLLYFHQGQMYARSGNIDAAKNAIEMAGKNDEAASAVFGPVAHPYMRATIAFLSKDFMVLQHGFDEIMKVPIKNYPEKTNLIFIPGRIHDMLEHRNESYDDIFHRTPSLPPLPSEKEWYLVTGKGKLFEQIADPRLSRHKSKKNMQFLENLARKANETKYQQTVANYWHPATFRHSPHIPYKFRL